MRILLVADGRSPTTRRWLDGLHAMGYTITLVSTFHCDRPPDLAGFKVIPVAFGRLAGSHMPPTGATAPARQGTNQAGLRRLVGRFRSLFQAGRYYLGPLSLVTSFDRARFRHVVRTFRPDLIHALRIPFEGMLASYAPAGVRVAVVDAEFRNQRP